MNRLTQHQIDTIRSIQQAGQLNPNNVNELWDIYFTLHGIYPMGSRTCDNCIRDVFDQLKQAMHTQENEPPVKMERAKTDADNYINKGNGKEK